MATIQIRVDDAVKAAADNLFDNLGLDTSTAVKIFLVAALDNEGIPFAVKRGKERSAYEKSIREAAADEAFILRTMDAQRDFAAVDAEGEGAW